MTLVALKSLLFKELESHYPQTEIQAFFQRILEDILGLSRIDFALSPERVVAYDVTTIIERLKNQEPIQYITGKTAFYGLEFKVTPATLIPRPETEELVSWILDDYHTTEHLRILDIGTGSGCIPISLDKNLKNAQVSTMDVSEKAISVAQENSKINNCDITFLHKSVLDIETLDKHYDIIVSNPPYVRNLEKVEIKENVLNHEPHLALFVEDTNPLIFYSKIADLAKKHLNKGGALYFEINQYLGPETVAMLQKRGFAKVELKKDIFGNDRMVKCHH